MTQDPTPTGQRLLKQLEASALIAEDNGARIRAHLDAASDVDAIVFECTLGSTPLSWDLAFRVETGALEGHLSVHPKAAESAAEFTALNPRHCPNAWVEWDTSQGDDSLPSVFAQFRRDVPLDTLCADLSRTLGASDAAARIHAWMSSLPEGAHARHVGKMLARRDGEIRVVIGGLKLRVLIAQLQEHALVQEEILQRALEPIGFHAGRAHLAVGFNPDLLPRVGVEAILPWSQMPSVARRLSAAGQCTADEAALLASWPEFCRLSAETAQPWPTPFGAHLKWVFEGENRVVRKLYLHIERQVA
jgi:hypothetical protein